MSIMRRLHIWMDMFCLEKAKLIHQPPHCLTLVDLTTLKGIPISLHPSYSKKDKAFSEDKSWPAILLMHSHIAIIPHSPTHCSYSLSLQLFRKEIFWLHVTQHKDLGIMLIATEKEIKSNLTLQCKTTKCNVMLNCDSIHCDTDQE